MLPIPGMIDKKSRLSEIWIDLREVEATTRHRKGLHSFWTALDNHKKAHEITLKHLFAVYNEDRRPQKDTSSSPLHACPTDASFQGGFLPVSSPATLTWNFQSPVRKYQMDTS